MHAATKRFLRWARWRGPVYVNDFLILILLDEGGGALTDMQGCPAIPSKPREPRQFGRLMGVAIDTETGYWYAPTDKLQRIATQTQRSSIPQRAVVPGA